MKVIVLMGGPSSEREISLRTGAAVFEALRRLGHDVLPVDPAPEGFTKVDGGEPIPGLIRAAASGVGGPGAPGFLAFLSAPQLSGCDAAFIALHGEAGEDGKIQAALDLAGLVYTGSGARASALAMDKDRSKQIFRNQGIPTPEWLCYSASGAPDRGELEAIGGFPVVVKPNDQGSTIGLTVVQEPDGLSDAFVMAAAYSREVVIERYVPGRELTVSVLDGEALPIVEIIPEGGLYDYTRKYTKGASRYVVPAKIDPDLSLQVQDLGLRSFEALGCRGFGRVDFRLSEDDVPYCLEVNTVPGMTETSLVPMAANALDMTFDQLVERILASATADVPRRGGTE
jgi:D-alanine-D-alanine ligase